jgi:tetratricopeptide (TPR) repeat protein
MKPKLSHSFLLVITMLPLLLKAQTDISQLYNQAQYQKVIQITDSLPLNDSTGYTPLFYRGLAQLALYRYADAIGTFEKALPFTTDSVQLMYLLAQAYDNGGNRQQAVKNYQLVVQKDSLYVPAKARLAFIYSLEKEFFPAIELYSSLIRYDSTNSYFYSKLAYCCTQTGIIPAALSYYQQAINYNRNDAESANKMINILLETNQFHEADSILDTLMITFPSDVDLIIKKACTQSVFGEYPEAIRLFKKAVQMGDSSLYMCKNYGNTLYNNGDFAESIFWLRRYAKECPEDDKNLYYLAIACQKDYRFQESLGLFDTLLMHVYNKPAIAQTFNDRAQTCKMYGDYLNYRDTTRTLAAPMYTASLNDLNQSVELNPKDSECYLKIGNLYEYQFHNTPMAVKYYEKYLQVLPEKPETDYMRDLLEQKVKSLMLSNKQ